MPSSRPATRFQDIIDNIDAIRRYTVGLGLSQYLADDKTVDASQHCLLRIGEAASKLGTLAEDLAPEIPWRSIRSLSNALRHAYDTVERHVLWDIIQDDLTPLREACARCVRELERSS